MINEYTLYAPLQVCPNRSDSLAFFQTRATHTEHRNFLHFTTVTHTDFRPFEQEATPIMSTATRHEGKTVVILEIASPAPTRMRRWIFGIKTVTW